MDITNIALPAQKALEQIRFCFSTYEFLTPWVLGIVFVLTLFFVRRHGLIYYGGRSQAFVVPLLFTLLAGAVFRDISVWTLSLLSTYLLLFFVEIGLNSYGRKQRVVAMFDTGVFIALLAHIHPVFFILLPIIFRVLRRLELLHKKQIGALILGIFSIFWCSALIIYIFSGIEVLRDSAVHYLLLPGDLMKNLQSYRIFSPQFLMRELSLIALIIMIVVQTAGMLPRSLERQRFTIDIHIRLVILLYIAHLLYEPEGASLYLCCAFYTSILSGYCLTQAKSMVLRSLILLPYLFLLYSCVQNLLNTTWTFS